MAEYISMDCLWKCETCFHHRNGKCAPEVWCENGENYRPDYSVLQFSAVDAEIVRHGRWVLKGQDVFCSECSEESKYTWFGAHSFSTYCPNCGAKMDEEKDNADS